MSTPLLSEMPPNFCFYTEGEQGMPLTLHGAFTGQNRPRGNTATTGAAKHPQSLAWEGTYHCGVSYGICLWDEDSERPCPAEFFDAFCLC